LPSAKYSPFRVDYIDLVICDPGVFVMCSLSAGIQFATL